MRVNPKLLKREYMKSDTIPTKNVTRKISCLVPTIFETGTRAQFRDTFLSLFIWYATSGLDRGTRCSCTPLIIHSYNHNPTIANLQELPLYYICISGQEYYSDHERWSLYNVKWHKELRARYISHSEVLLIILDLHLFIKRDSPISLLESSIPLVDPLDTPLQTTWAIFYRVHRLI